MTYSFSRIQTYFSCPLKFKYTYILKPDIEKKKGIEAFLGSRVHEVLEKLYKDLKYNKLNTLNELLSYYEEVWNNNFDETIEIVKDYSSENYKSLGIGFIENYYKKYHPFNQGKTLGLEMKINLSFVKNNKTYNLIGYIDRLTMVSEKHFEIHDYKTNNKTKTQEEVDKDNQLALYAIAIKEMYPSVEKIELVWHFLESGLEMRSIRSDKELENLKQEIINNIDIIEHAKKEDIFPPKESALCDWCDYKVLCPVKAHAMKIKQLPENEYLKEDGYVLVNNYFELTERKKEYLQEIEPELEKLKEAIISYCEKNDLEKLVGEKKNLLVRQYTSVKLPEKNTKERKELEKLIKDANSWELFSDLSYIQISNLLKEGMLNSSFKEKLLTYISLEKIYRLYLNKKM